jgi:hypothetical protein
MVVPVPGVLEGLDLRVGAVAGLRLEQDVVIGVRVERRVEVDEVDALARDMLAENIEIVAVKQLVRHKSSPERGSKSSPERGGGPNPPRHGEGDREAVEGAHV